MCVNRDKMIQVVFRGYATKVESLVGHISPLENPNLGPTKYNCAAANTALDKLGYKRGSDGIRVAPATTRQVRAGRTPDALRHHHADLDRLQRQPDVRDRQGGLREARRQGHAEGRRRLDRERTRSRRTRSATPSKNIGYSKFDIAMWDWIAGTRPGLPALGRDEGPVVLVERHRLGQPGLRQALREAGHHREPRAAEGHRLQDAEDGVRRLRLHAAHEPRRAGRHLDEVDRLQEPAERVLEDVLHEPAGRLG